MGRALAAGLLALVLLAGCGGNGDEAPLVATAEEEAAAPDEPLERESCRNDEAGYSVEYPADWHTNEGSVAPACTYFDPEPIDVPEATEFLDVGVTIAREPVEFAEVAGGGFARTVVEREDTEIAGRPAARVEAEATGEALLDAGVRSYQVYVDLDGETLVASTYDVGGVDYEEAKEVLDGMMATLELEPTSP